MINKAKTGPSLWHYTVNTSHGRWSPRSEVNNRILELMREKLVTAIQHFQADVELLPGFALERLTVTDTGAEWVIAAHHGPDPGPLAECRLLATGIPELHIYLLPRLADYPDAAHWLGEVDRCLAWAILDTLADSRTE